MSSNGTFANGSSNALLETLVRGALPDECLGLPVVMLDWFFGRTSPGSLPPTVQREVLGSMLGPAFLVPAAPHLDPSLVWSAPDLLVAPPLGLNKLLRFFATRHQHADVFRRSRSLQRLEALVNDLDGGMSARLVRSLGLPRSLGGLLDGQVLLYEEGAPVEASSAVAPLLVLLDRLGVRRIFEHLDMSSSGCALEALSSTTIDELKELVQALRILDAPAAALRLVVLLVLAERSASGSVRSDPTLAGMLTGLVSDRRAKVPADKVVAVWSLVNR